MPTMLENLQLEEVSLVDKAANQHAEITLFKRDNSEEETMEAIEKMTDDQKAEMDKMSKPMKDKMKMYMEEKGMSYDKAKAMCNEEMKKSLEAENERLRKALLDNGFVIKADAVEKKAPEEFIEYEGEKVNKADIPAPILKHLEALEVEKAENAIAKKAEETLPNFNKEAAVALMKAGLDEDTLKALKAADKLFEGMTEEVGKTAAQGDMEDPQDKMNALVEKTATEQNISKAKAYEVVAKTAEGKALVKAIYKGDK